MVQPKIYLCKVDHTHKVGHVFLNHLSFPSVLPSGITIMLEKFLERIAHELIVKRLGQTAWFQRFALRMDSSIKIKQKEIKELSEQAKEEFTERFGDKISQMPQKFDVKEFAKTFVDEVKKEMNKKS